MQFEGHMVGGDIQRLSASGVWRGDPRLSVPAAGHPARIDAASEVKPGNQAAGMLEIKTGNHGQCTFNTHIASCGTVVPPGAKCDTRKLDDPQSEGEGSGGATRQFNRIP